MPVKIDDLLVQARKMIAEASRESEEGKKIALHWVGILEAQKLCLRHRGGHKVLLAQDGRNLAELADDTYEAVLLKFGLNRKEEGGTGNFHYLTALRLLAALPGGDEIRRWHTKKFGV